MGSALLPSCIEEDNHAVRFKPVLVSTNDQSVTIFHRYGCYIYVDRSNLQYWACLRS